MKKSSMTMTLVVSLIILSISLALIITVWNMFFSRAEESTAESLCMGFNALRMQTKIEKGPFTLNPTPRTCKTLDKEIPSDIYPQTKEGAMEEMRNLITKCWWMFLEGAEQNMFESNLGVNLPFGKDPCFTCYRFKIKSNIDEISLLEFDKSMIETTYLADIDSDFDDCAPIGGGKCISEEYIDGKRCNDPSYKQLKTTVASNKCDKGEQCCISSKSNECENMGGICQDLGSGQKCRDKNDIYTKQYDKWSCRTGTCCIQDDNYYSYLKYVQSYRGDGAILYGLKDQKFEPGSEEYAITFISPKEECGWGCKAVIGGLIVGGALLTGGGSIPLVLGGAVALTAGTAAGAAAAGDYLTKPDKLKINTILVSELDPVINKCAVKEGTND